MWEMELNRSLELGWPTPNRCKTMKSENIIKEVEFSNSDTYLILILFFDF